jgi:hypothetical protein
MASLVEAPLRTHVFNMRLRVWFKEISSMYSRKILQSASHNHCHTSLGSRLHNHYHILRIRHRILHSHRYTLHRASHIHCNSSKYDNPQAASFLALLDQQLPIKVQLMTGILLNPI